MVGICRTPARSGRSDRIQSGGEPQHITVSIGIAALAKDRDTRPSSMAAADTALYRAKSEGRNRVCIET
ncbi:MAG: diguanylate cyclase [Thermomonas sp.]